MLLNGTSKAKKKERKDIVESVTEKNGHQTSINTNSMAFQCLESLVGICKFVVMLVVLKQYLNSFQWSENFFC